MWVVLLIAPCLANLSTSLFLTMFVRALTLQMLILWWEVFSIITIQVMRSLSRRSYWEDEFLMWLRQRYTLLRLSMNMNVSVGSILVCSAAMRSVYNSAMRILGCMGG